MKRSALVLLALLSLIPLAQAVAQAPPAAPVPSTAEFLATLSGVPAQAPADLTPAPSFMTGCTTSAQCPTGQLCCFVCGNPPAEGGEDTCKACVTPIKGRCPLVV